MTWIQTFTGRQFWPLNPKAEDVYLMDIAHALSLKCRFNGHCRQFYSVAEHSVRVMRDVARRQIVDGCGDEYRNHTLALALMHDASEAYLPDVARPIKHCRQLLGLLEADCRLSLEILKAFRLRVDHEALAVIHKSDARLLATEARDLMAWPRPAEWADLPAPLPEIIQPWPPDYAKAVFVEEAVKLGLSAD